MATNILTPPKKVRMIPLQKVTNASVSAYTAGSGGTGTKGIVDLCADGGYEAAVVTVYHGAGTTKIKQFALGFHSSAIGKWSSAQALPISGASGVVLSGKTASGSTYAFVINLKGKTNLRRYMNCLLITSTTSCPMAVTCDLYKGGAVPAGTTGFTSVTYIN